MRSAGRLAARDLALVEVDDLTRLLGDVREALEELLRVGGGDAREALLAVRERLGASRPGRDARLGLAHELRRALEAREIAREEIVRDEERVLVVRLDRELLELLGELAIGAASAHDLEADARRVLVAADLDEAIERAAERFGALGAASRAEPPLDELRRDDAPSTRGDRRARRTLSQIGDALIGELGERRERLVAAVQLVGEDVREA